MKGLIFVYVMTYGGAVVSLFNPFAGFLVYICFAIVKPPSLWYWSVTPGSYDRIIALSFLFGWAIHGFGDRKFGKATPLVIAVAGYYFWAVLSTMFSPNPELGKPFLEYFAKVLIPFVAGLTLIRNWTHVKWMFWVVVGSCAYLALEINQSYLNGRNVAADGFLFLDNNSISILMVTGFGLALVFGLEDNVLWRRGLFFLSAAAMAHVPMLSMSRGGMTGALCAAVFAGVIIPKNRQTWLMMIGTVVVGSLLAGPSVVARYSTTMNDRDTRDSSAQSRIDLWRNCTDAMLHNPLFGVGVEHWPIVAHEVYGWTEGKEAHSLWFQTAAELGVPGITFLLSFYVIAVWKCWRASRLQYFEKFPPAVLRAVVVGLVGFCVSASFVTVEGFELPYYVGLLGAGAIKVAYMQQHAVPQDEYSELDVEYGIA